MEAEQKRTRIVQFFGTQNRCWSAKEPHVQSHCTQIQIVVVFCNSRLFVGEMNFIKAEPHITRLLSYLIRLDHRYITAKSAHGVARTSPRRLGHLARDVFFWAGYQKKNFLFLRSLHPLERVVWNSVTLFLGRFGFSMKCNTTFAPQTWWKCEFSARQHTAAHCSTLQHTAAHCSTLQHTAAQCSTLQHTAAHCGTLHHTAAHAKRCNALRHTSNTLHSNPTNSMTVSNPWSRQVI